MHKRAAEREMVKIAKREALKHTEEQRSILKDKFGVCLFSHFVFITKLLEKSIII